MVLTLAELLVRIVDGETHPNTTIDKKIPKAGDVIAIRPDGHPWGHKDTGDKRRVLYIPGLTVEEANQKYMRSDILELPWNDGRFDSNVVNALKTLSKEQKGELSRESADSGYQSTKVQVVK